MTRYIKGGRKLKSVRIDPALVKLINSTAAKLDESFSQFMERAARERIARKGKKK